MAMADATDSGSCGGSSSGGGGRGGGGGLGGRDRQGHDPSTVPTGDDLDAATTTMTNEDEHHAHDDAGAAGYTPLDDLGVHGGAVHMPGIGSHNGAEENGDGGLASSTFVFSYHQSSGAAPEGWSDYSDDEEGGGGDRDNDNDNDGSARAEVVGGAFYANPAAFDVDNDGDVPSATAGGWTRMSPGGDDNGGRGGGGGGGDNEADFRAIADRALRSLDEEYISTVRAGGDGGRREVGERSGPPSQDGSGEAAAVESEEHANDDEDGNDADDEDVREEEEEQSAPAIVDEAPSAAQRQLPVLPPPPPTAKKELPPIDADAVRRAVQSIRIKSPGLTSTLDDGAERRLQKPKAAVGTASAPKHHPIIPPAPLAAFRRTSPKAIRATANLSRSATLSEAIVRCVPRLLLSAVPDAKGGEEERSSARNSSHALTVHVLGADHVECKTDGTVRAAFGPWVRWVVAACPSPPARIEVVLLGPNVPKEAEGRGSVNLLPAAGSSTSEVRSAVARCVNCLYHDYVGGSVAAESEAEAQAREVVPDLVVAFNAGIWGYDEWRPTLKALCGLRTAVPVVITAYTVEEAEDDAEVIAEIVAESSNEAGSETGKCLWEAEANPFGSREERETATAIKGREYHENGAWQAWSLGGVAR